MQDKTYTEFDVEKIFSEEIAPLLKDIVEKCRKNNIPFIASFAVKNDGKRKKTKYINEGNLTGSNDIHLYQDRITNCLLAINGADVTVFPDVKRFDQIASDYINDVDFDKEESMEEEYSAKTGATIIDTSQEPEVAENYNNIKMLGYI